MDIRTLVSKLFCKESLKKEIEALDNNYRGGHLLSVAD